PSTREGDLDGAGAPGNRLFHARLTSAVDLLQLAGRPLHGVLRRGALHALGEHVNDDVLAVDLGRLGRRRAGEADDPGVVSGRLEALHRLVDRVPERMTLPLLGGADG